MKVPSRLSYTPGERFIIAKRVFDDYAFIIDILLKEGANRNVTRPVDRLPIIWCAALETNGQVVGKLLAHGTSVNTFVTDGHTLLFRYLQKERMTHSEATHISDQRPPMETLLRRRATKTSYEDDSISIQLQHILSTSVLTGKLCYDNISIHLQQIASISSVS